MKTRRKSPRKRAGNTRQEWAIAAVAVGVIVSGMAAMNLPDIIDDPSLSAANVLTVLWVVAMCWLLSRAMTRIESKIRARFATQPNPQSVSQNPRRKTGTKIQANFVPSVEAPIERAEPVFDEASAFANPARRRRPPRRKIHDDDAAWVRHLRRSAAAVRIQTEEPRETKQHNTHAPLFDDPLDDIGTDRQGYVLDAA